VVVELVVMLVVLEVVVYTSERQGGGILVVVVEVVVYDSDGEGGGIN